MLITSLLFHLSSLPLCSLHRQLHWLLIQLWPLQVSAVWLLSFPVGVQEELPGQGEEILDEEVAAKHDDQHQRIDVRKSGLDEDRINEGHTQHIGHENKGDLLEKLLGEMPPVTTSVEKAILKSAGKTEEGVLMTMMDDVFADLPEEYALEIKGTKDVRWKCDCSRQRMMSALATIGKADLREIIEEDGQAELRCNFCNSKYTFDRKELEEIFKKM